MDGRPVTLADTFLLRSYFIKQPFFAFLLLCKRSNNIGLGVLD